MAFATEYFWTVQPSFFIGALECIFGAVLFPALFHAYHFVCQCIRPFFKCLQGPSKGETLDICNKLVSSTFAVTTVWFGWSVLGQSGNTDKSVMKEEHPLGKIFFEDVNVSLMMGELNYSRGCQF